MGFKTPAVGWISGVGFMSSAGGFRVSGFGFIIKGVSFRVPDCDHEFAISSLCVRMSGFPALDMDVQLLAWVSDSRR